jgi:hypothetical protein
MRMLRDDLCFFMQLLLMQRLPPHLMVVEVASGQ